MASVRLHEQPNLNNPILIAAWPGMGGVAVIAARHLRDKLGASELGNIEPYEFFDPTRVQVENDVVQTIKFPQNTFYFSKGQQEGDKDLIIFIAESQPTTKGYVLASTILDTAQLLGVTKVCTLAATPAHVHYCRKTRVLGISTSPELDHDLRSCGAVPMGTGSIAGMNGVLLGVAKQRGIDGMCLLGEIPIYMTGVANPRASKAILDMLPRILGNKIDVSSFDSWISEADEYIERSIQDLISQNSEDAEQLMSYFERLKAQADAEETEELPEYSEDLIRDVDYFLKGQLGEMEDKG
ncbi:MAG: PAC2 family protein [Chloroflexota bacterium]|nr:PAC2 family protein [Chloroflexota bacterium]